jgi:hypothetical protein
VRSFIAAASFHIHGVFLYETELCTNKISCHYDVCCGVELRYLCDSCRVICCSASILVIMFNAIAVIVCCCLLCRYLRSGFAPSFVLLFRAPSFVLFLELRYLYCF